jgi:hypothetical protein
MQIEESILVDFNTYKATKNYFTYEEVAPITVKGKSGRINVYIPLEEKTKVHAEVPADQLQSLIGRKKLTDLVTSAAKMCLRGEQRFLWVEGEVGLGKSALVKHSRCICSSLSLKTLFGACESTHKHTEYYVWGQILSQMLDMICELEEGRLTGARKKKKALRTSDVGDSTKNKELVQECVWNFLRSHAPGQVLDCL